VVGEWGRCLGSLAQLVVNLTGIVAAAALVLLLSRRSRSNLAVPPRAAR
jgi:hypothetical protein